MYHLPKVVSETLKSRQANVMNVFIVITANILTILFRSLKWVECINVEINRFFRTSISLLFP